MTVCADAVLKKNIPGIENNIPYKGNAVLNANKMIGVDDLKLYLLNASSFALASMNWIEPALEILLLALTIGYTVHKWLLLHKKKK